MTLLFTITVLGNIIRQNIRRSFMQFTHTYTFFFIKRIILVKKFSVLLEIHEERSGSSLNLFHLAIYFLEIK